MENLSMVIPMSINSAIAIGVIIFQLVYFFKGKKHKTRIQKVHEAKAKTYVLSLVVIPLLILMPFWLLWTSAMIFIVQIVILSSIATKRPSAVVYVVPNTTQIECQYFITKYEMNNFISSLPRKTKYKVINSIKRGQSSNLLKKMNSHVLWTSKK